MKRWRLYCLLMLFPAQRLAAQDTLAGRFQVTGIPSEGLLLNKEWKYQAGDDPSWALPGFNTAGWSGVDPSGELHHLEEVKQSDIGWFRLDMQVADSLLDQTVAFIISGLGAAEVYHNGVIVFRFGKVSSDFSKEETRFFTNQLLSLKLGKQAHQVLAIRHSFNKRNLYLKFTFERPVVKIVLKRIDRAFSDHIKDNDFDATLRSIQVSFYLPLGFLLVFLFYWFRLQKEYLYSGIFCFCMFAAIMLHIFSLSEPTTVSRSNYLLYGTQVLYIIGALSFLNGIYILYKRKKSWFYYLIILYGLCSLGLYFISYDQSGLFNAFFFPLINLEFLRLSWQAIRRRRKGAWILFITSLLLNLSLLLYIWFTITKQVEASAYLQSISFIIPGFGLSLFYAGEFARTASALHFRVIEVEKLSHEMVASEKEKQQILGAQNETLEKQVADRTIALTRSLSELKEAQTTLIQREKMASLGELTAGIAHEIQNPLNFVNNFSEVNEELIEEMEQEMSKGNLENARSIASAIKQNFEKINQHGKRADAIVKGMLQHSRSAGIKEPADINALVDEYFRLSYHGLRAKDKSFNAITSTDLDPEAGKISISRQDLGRALLNLINNAFHAVIDKQRLLREMNTGDIIKYEPKVTVSTRRTVESVEITVRDNGPGIPPKAFDKIFQPFFTTKPAGQGTGLGLSISYDIVRAHGGEIKVKSMENEGTVFTISLPVT